MLGDKVWFRRFINEPFRAEGFDQILHEEFQHLREAREELDNRVLAWSDGLTNEMLISKFMYASMAGPEPKSCPLWVAVAHFYNHQTHHRGQITTLLSQLNLDVGVTDLLALPGLVTVDAAR